jgi:hypothetical protein
MQAILERGRKKTKKKNTSFSFFYPQSRNESDPLQKAGNSVVFILMIKTSPE